MRVQEKMKFVIKNLLLFIFSFNQYAERIISMQYVTSHSLLTVLLYVFKAQASA